MSKNAVYLCDIKDCDQLASYTIPLFLHGQQKGEDSFGAHLLNEKVDLCGKHEMEYRTSLPKMELKKEMADHETQVSSYQVPVVEALLS